jgi:immune inhibitor A
VPAAWITIGRRAAGRSTPIQPAAPVFDDNNSYWDPANPWGSVIVPTTGTSIRLVGTSTQGSFMQVIVSPSK